MNHGSDKRTVSGFSHFKAKPRRVNHRPVKNNVSSVARGSVEKSVRRDGYNAEGMDSRKRRDSMRYKDGNLVKELTETIGSTVVNGEGDKKSKKGVDKKSGAEKMEKGAKKSKTDSPEFMLRVGLDMCSKKGDVMGALKLYDSAQTEGIEMGQYHYTVLLYLCSSAAIGVVLPAKSGSGSRSLSTVDSTSEVSSVNSEDLGKVGEICKGNFCSIESNSNYGLFVESTDHPINLEKIELNSNGFPNEGGKDNLGSSLNGTDKLEQVCNGVAKPNPQAINGTVHSGTDDCVFKTIKDGSNAENYEIRMSEDFKKYALQRGFEIYERMCLEKVLMNEASLTSVARMALAMGDGDMAFDMVKQMKALGINPRLRSYGPALSAFCNCGDIDKAFAVEEHMLEHGVHPEEPELEALLRVSIEAGRSDKVYYLLHKLRKGVRKVSPSTAYLLEKWFKSKVASKVGKRKWDQRLIRKAIENGGGGWHGHGWLGKGKWTVSRTSIGSDGRCNFCREKLATIDLDPVETEKFAESVASIATKREKNSSFQKFQVC